jgi:hypothetical protein
MKINSVDFISSLYLVVGTAILNQGCVDDMARPFWLQWYAKQKLKILVARTRKIMEGFVQNCTLLQMFLPHFRYGVYVRVGRGQLSLGHRHIKFVCNIGELCADWRLFPYVWKSIPIGRICSILIGPKPSIVHANVAQDSVIWDLAADCISELIEGILPGLICAREC